MNCINADNYGLVPNDPNFDNSSALTSALNDAFLTGQKVCLPAGVFYYSTTLNVPAGVIIIGTGTGKDPLNTSPTRGSVLAYTGSAFAIEMTGHNSGLRDLNLDNKSDSLTPALGAIKILADGQLVESIGIDNVQVYSFINNATGLKLEAINSGGIAYTSITRLRVRHASTAIHITEDSTSFINSNRFYNFVFSGTGCEYGLRIDGGNNNVFYAAVLEPRSSENGHIVVENGEITTPDIRIEANEQDRLKPVLHFHSKTYGSRIEGFSEGKGILDEGDNFVNTRSNSNLFTNEGINVFKNAPFKGVNNSIVPEWEIIDGPGVTILSKDPEVLKDHNVIELEIPSGTLCKFRPLLKNSPSSLETEKYDHASFGLYLKASYDKANTNIVLTHQTGSSSLSSSSPYPGDNQWHYMGMTANTNSAQDLYPRLYIDNSQNADSLTIEITTPSYVFGIQSLAGLSSPKITSAGGQITGLLSMGLSSLDGTNYISGTNYLIIPEEGNYFNISGTQTISRINHQSAKQLPTGTVITLIFNDASLTVQNGSYLSLLNGNYVSSSGSSLTLISNGNGTWQEVSRNI